jgi:hypothetical protein
VNVPSLGGFFALSAFAASRAALPAASTSGLTKLPREGETVDGVAFGSVAII